LHGVRGWGVHGGGGFASCPSSRCLVLASSLCPSPSSLAPPPTCFLHPSKAGEGAEYAREKVRGQRGSAPGTGTSHPSHGLTLAPLLCLLLRAHRRVRVPSTSGQRPRRRLSRWEGGGTYTSEENALLAHQTMHEDGFLAYAPAALPQPVTPLLCSPFYSLALLPVPRSPNFPSPRVERPLSLSPSLPPSLSHTHSFSHTLSQAGAAAKEQAEGAAHSTAEKVRGLRLCLWERGGRKEGKSTVDQHQGRGALC
jgi:hypothetical protein